MSVATNAPVGPVPENRRFKQGLRLILAIPLAVVAVWIGVGIYEPFSLIGGMIMDSCSAIYTWWEIWLRVLWPGILVVSALVPPILIAWGRRWRWVVLSAVVGVAVSITWYVLWFVIAMVGCSP